MAVETTPMRTHSAASAPDADHRITALAYDPARDSHEQIETAAISDVLASEKLVWLDIQGPTEDDVRMLREELSIHPLALEELDLEHPRAKCAEYPGHYALVVYAGETSPDGRVQLRELVLFVGQRYLVTVHRDAFPEIDECVRRWKSNAAPEKGAIATPLYWLLDTLVDGFFPLTDELADRVEALEDRLFEGNGLSGASDLFGLKKDLLALRRVVSGQRDALNLLLRQDVPIFPGQTLLYFQSVYDHLVRLVENVDTYRDLLSSAMDMHLSVISNRLNQVMKALTVVATILMTCSLITGIYGMNFHNIPELSWRYGYYAALGLMAAIAVGLAVAFKKLRWF